MQSRSVDENYVGVATARKAVSTDDERVLHVIDS